MFIVKMDPSFDSNLGNPIMNPAIISQATEVAHNLNDFVRKCLEKIISPESLALFVNMNSSIPGLDLELTFFSPQKHRIQVFFKRKEIGSALSITEITPDVEPFIKTRIFIEKMI